MASGVKSEESDATDVQEKPSLRVRHLDSTTDTSTKSTEDQESTALENSDFFNLTEQQPEPAEKKKSTSDEKDYLLVNDSKRTKRNKAIEKMSLVASEHAHKRMKELKKSKKA